MPAGFMHRYWHDDRGTILLVVLTVFLTIAVLSSSFIWFMQQQQTRAGTRYRSAMALALAEAGVHRALSILETVAPDGRSSGRHWRASDHTETMLVGSFEGQFTLALADDVDGAILVTSVGQVGGVRRSLRARVYLASPALLAAVYGASIVRLEDPPTAVFIMPYGVTGDHPWLHIASGRGFWLASQDVLINDPARPFQAAQGPVDAPSDTDPLPGRPDPIRVLLGEDARLRLDRHSSPMRVEELRTLGVNIDRFVFTVKALPPAPDVNSVFYQRLAADNRHNAGLNEAAGKYLGDGDLARKVDSLYSEQEFAKLQAYVNAGSGPSWLHGVIYVKGGLRLDEGQALQVREGALITEGPVELERDALLEVLHSQASRTLPGLITLGKSDLIVAPGTRVRVHGLAYIARTIDVQAGASLDIVGSMLANGQGFSVSISGGTAVIRYDPAVLGTPGLRVADNAPVTAWVARWEELPSGE